MRMKVAATATLTVGLLLCSTPAAAHSGVGAGPEFARFAFTLLGHLLLVPLLVFALATWTREQPSPSRFVATVLPVISIVVAALVLLTGTLVTLVTGVGYTVLGLGNLLWAAFSKEEMIGVSAAVLLFSLANLRRRKRGALRRSSKPAWLAGGAISLVAMASGPIVQLASWEVKTVTAFRRFDDVSHQDRDLAFSADGATLIAGGLTSTRRRGTTIRSRTRFSAWAIGGTFAWPKVARSVDTGDNPYHTLNGLWVSSDGARVITSETTGKVALWSLETGEQVGVIPFDERKRAMNAICRAAPFGVRAGARGPLEWLDLSELERTAIPLHVDFNDEIRTVACAPAGDRIAVARRQRIAVLTPPSGAPVAEIDLPFGIEQLVFGPDGKTIVAAGYDAKTRASAVRTWSLPDGSLRSEFGTKARVVALVSHPDGERIAVGTNDGRVSLHSASSGKLLRLIIHLQTSKPFSLAFSADGKQLATGWGGSHPTILLFRL